MQTEHDHVSPAGFGGGFMPAFDQSKPCTAGFGLSSRGASHTVHFSAPEGLLSMHTPQLQLSPEGFGGGFIPAACQLNPPEDVAAGAGGTAEALEKSKVGREETEVALATWRA